MPNPWAFSGVTDPTGRAVSETTNDISTWGNEDERDITYLGNKSTSACFYIREFSDVDSQSDCANH